jgi:hypothetical protein
MGFTQTTAWEANVKSLVANEEIRFNVLKFRTSQKLVKLRNNQQGNLEKINSSSGKKLEREFS